MKSVRVLDSPYIFLIISLCGLTSCQQQGDSQSQQKPIMKDSVTWPDLPTKGFIRGRAASKDDITKGNAAFVLADQDGNPRGKPIDIEIPQYCYHINAETRRRSPAILIQAEQDNHGRQLVAIQQIGGGNMVCLLAELELLGKDRPNSP